MVKIDRFQVDRNIGYLIQQTTKDSTQEILGYFYGITQFVVDNINRKSKANWIAKDIVLFYKETPITYRIQIQGPGPAYNGGARDTNVNVEVTFPKTKEDHDVADLMNAVVESGLDLAEETNMPEFKRPNLKTPACLRQVRIKQDEQ